MCIFSGDVENVKNTKIFVAPCARRTTQLTVYSNRVNLKNEAFMVLPFPGKFVKFVDLTERKDFFEDLEISFPKSKSRSYSFEPKLEQVGSYQAVAMSDFKELSLISHKLNINLHPEVLSFLEKHYSFGFGFVVFRLMKDKETQYHPFAYMHTTDTGKMFIPTIHYHSRTDKQVTADWDHKIYLLNRQLNTGVVQIQNFKVPVSENVFDFRSLPGDLELPQYLTKYEIRGNSFPNMDLEC